MAVVLLAAYLLSVLVGLSLGLLGGGGAILTVPILTYVVGLEAKEAIPMSLLIVGITSLASSISHARAGRVQWRTGYLFGAAGMVGAFGGGNLAHFIPGNVLLLMFAGLIDDRYELKALPQFIIQSAAAGIAIGIDLLPSESQRQ